MKVLFVFGRDVYAWSGWYGCQLESYEWLPTPAGSERVLEFFDGLPGQRIRIFGSRRVGLKIRKTWAIESRGSLDEHNSRILEFRKRLRITS